MKLEKKYEVITNEGQRLFVIGHGSFEIGEHAKKALKNERSFYMLFEQIQLWEFGYNGSSKSIYALTPEDVKKFNSYEETLDPWVYDRLPTESDCIFENEVCVYDESDPNNWTFLTSEAVAFYEITWISRARMKELGIEELPKPKQNRLNIK